MKKNLLRSIQWMLKNSFKKKNTENTKNDQHILSRILFRNIFHKLMWELSRPSFHIFACFPHLAFFFPVPYILHTWVYASLVQFVEPSKSLETEFLNSRRIYKICRSNSVTWSRKFQRREKNIHLEPQGLRILNARSKKLIKNRIFQIAPDTRKTIILDRRAKNFTLEKDKRYKSLSAYFFPSSRRSNGCFKTQSAVSMSIKPASTILFKTLAWKVFPLLKIEKLIL